MKGFRFEPGADRCLDDIYDYTLSRWGARQANDYIEALFDEFTAIAERRAPWRPIAADLGVNGFCRKWRHYYIYWKVIDRQVVIVAILHDRMHQMARLQAAITDETD